MRCGGHPATSLPGEQHLSAARAREADHRAQHGRLAHAVAAEHRGDLPLAHFQVDALQDMAAPVVGVQAFQAQHQPDSPR